MLLRNWISGYKEVITAEGLPRAIDQSQTNYNYEAELCEPLEKAPVEYIPNGSYTADESSSIDNSGDGYAHFLGTDLSNITLNSTFSDSGQLQNIRISGDGKYYDFSCKERITNSSVPTKNCWILNDSSIRGYLIPIEMRFKYNPIMHGETAGKRTVTQVDFELYFTAEGESNQIRFKKTF